MFEKRPQSPRAVFLFGLVIVIFGFLVGDTALRNPGSAALFGIPGPVLAIAILAVGAYVAALGGVWLRRDKRNGA
jgi:hypothetical protein